MRRLTARAGAAARVVVVVLALLMPTPLRATARGLVWSAERLADLADFLETAADGGCEGR